MKKIIAVALTCISFLAHAQSIITIAGSGTMSSTGDGGSAATATLNQPFAGVFDKYGNYYFSEVVGCRIRRIAPSGIITTVAGTGSCGYNSDGIPATNAKLNDPKGLTVDTIGNIFIADGFNNRVRKVDVASGLISTITGNGTGSNTGNGGSAALATVYNPYDVCFDKFGNLFIADEGNKLIRKIDNAGIISSYAGNGGTTFSGEGGPATNAGISGVLGLCTDTSGNLYMAGRFVSRVMKVSTSGILTTIAGTGLGYATGDGGPATAAQINPQKLTFDDTGNLYVSCYYKHSIRKINTAGIISTVVGDTTAGFAGDGGSAVVAKVNNPVGISFDPCGNMNIADQSNQRIRKVTFNGTGTPTITVTGVTTATLGSTVTVNAIVGGAGSSYTIKWFKNATLFSTTTVPTATYTKGAGTDVITARVVPTMLTCYDSATSAGHTITQQTVGMSSVQFGEFQIFPNPVGNIIAISGTEPINSVLITDIMGRVVATLPKASTKKHELQWHIGNLPKGVYFVKVNDWYVQRFLKE